MSDHALVCKCSVYRKNKIEELKSGEYDLESVDIMYIILDESRGWNNMDEMWL